MVGLSRTRFRQLVASGVFPLPKRNAETSRPFYDVEGQQTCMSVRSKNCGINGRPVLFYSRRPTATPIVPRRRSSVVGTSSARKNKTRPTPKPKTSGLIEGLRQLGLDDLSDQKVADGVHACFPQGIGSKPQEEILLAVFRHFAGQNSGGNVG